MDEAEGGSAPTAALRSRGRTHILVHQACFADTAIAKDDNLL